MSVGWALFTILIVTNGRLPYTGHYAKHTFTALIHHACVERFVPNGEHARSLLSNSPRRWHITVLLDGKTEAQTEQVACPRSKLEHLSAQSPLSLQPP